MSYHLQGDAAPRPERCSLQWWLPESCIQKACRIMLRNTKRIAEIEQHSKSIVSLFNHAFLLPLLHPLILINITYLAQSIFGLSSKVEHSDEYIWKVYKWWSKDPSSMVHIFVHIWVSSTNHPSILWCVMFQTKVRRIRVLHIYKIHSTVIKRSQK